MLTQQKFVNPSQNFFLFEKHSGTFTVCVLRKHKRKINKEEEEWEINKPVDKMNFISISWLPKQEIQAFLMRHWAIIASLF